MKITIELDDHDTTDKHVDKFIKLGENNFTIFSTKSMRFSICSSILDITITSYFFLLLIFKISP